MACVTATRGAILEVGVGHWSTPLLHRYCVAGGRRLVSLDEDEAFARQFYDLRVCHHELRSAEYSRDLPPLASEKWSVAFLDHSPGWRRAADALLFLDSAEFIVVHDYANEIVEGFAPILKRWPHSRVAQFSPKTLVLGKREIPAW